MILRLLAVLAAVTMGVLQGAKADVVAARTLKKGTVLVATDLSATEQQSIKQKENLVGHEMRRSIFVGRKIHADDVGPVTLVHRNDVISLTYSSAGIGLRTEGRALSSGGMGDMISVMNMDTRVTVTARVISAKQAEVLR